MCRINHGRKRPGSHTLLSRFEIIRLKVTGVHTSTSRRAPCCLCQRKADKGGIGRVLGSIHHFNYPRGSAIFPSSLSGDVALCTNGEFLWLYTSCSVYSPLCLHSCLTFSSDQCRRRPCGEAVCKSCVLSLSRSGCPCGWLCLWLIGAKSDTLYVSASVSHTLFEFCDPPPSQTWALILSFHAREWN